jgi:signal transduction histidine kinase
MNRLLVEFATKLTKVGALSSKRPKDVIKSAYAFKSLSLFMGLLNLLLNVIFCSNNSRLVASSFVVLYHILTLYLIRKWIKHFVIMMIFIDLICLMYLFNGVSSNMTSEGSFISDFIQGLCIGLWLSNGPISLVWSFQSFTMILSFIVFLSLRKLDDWNNLILLLIPLLLAYTYSQYFLENKEVQISKGMLSKPQDSNLMLRKTIEILLKNETAASFTLSIGSISDFNKFRFPSIEGYFFITEEVNNLEPKSSPHTMLNQGTDVFITDKMRLPETDSMNPLLELLTQTIVEVIENPDIFNNVSKENISVADLLQTILPNLLEETLSMKDTDKPQTTVRPYFKSLSCTHLSSNYPLFAKIGPKFRVNLSVIGIEKEVLIIIKFQKENQKRIIKQLLRDQEDNNLFLASIVHDLRSPLIGIVYMIEAAVELLRQEDVTKQLRIAISNCQLLSCLIDDILDFTSSKNNKFRIVLSHFYLNDLIDEVITIMKPDADLRNLVLEYLSPIPYDLRLNSDPKRLKQVLINLISNALKFTNEGFVHVTARKIDDYILEIHVIDSGSGIKKDTISSLSIPYLTFDNETGNNKRGIGLGLHNCKQILGYIGPGGLNIQSREGEGSDFGFKIYRDVHNPTSELLSSLLSKKDMVLNTLIIIFLKKNLGQIKKNKYLIFREETAQRL